MNIMAVRWGHLYGGTPAELALEDAVAALGVPYRTQFPGWKYGVRAFPDYFLPTLKLVIEVDDDSHLKAEKVLADAERTAELEKAWGVRVVRCTNSEALDNPARAVRAMLSSVGLWPLPSHRPTLRQALPALRKAPQKIKREAVAAAKRAARTSKSPSCRRRPVSPPSAGRKAAPTVADPAFPPAPARSPSAS